MKGFDRSNILAVILLFVLAIVSYLPAFNAGFVFDDHILIEKNPSIRELKYIPRFFVSKDARIPREFSDLQSDIYRPLQSASYALSHSLWGLDARFFHAENILLHLINGLLLYLLILYIFKSKLLSFLSSLLFLVHPVQVEAVTYLSGRSDVLSLCFFLLSLFAFIISTRSERPLGLLLGTASSLFFIVSLFSKEMAVTLPFVIILYLLFFESGERKVSVRGIFKKTWSFFLILGVFFLIRTYNLGKIAQQSPGDLAFVFLIMARVFVVYLRLIFFPVGLTFFHELDIEGSGLRLDTSYIFYSIVIISFLYICVASMRRDKSIAFLLFSYLAALLPVSNIIPIKSFVQERFLYFPSIFILSAISYALVKLWHRICGLKTNAALKRVSISLMVVIAFTLTSTTFSRNLDWKDEKTLVKKEMRLHPEDGKLYFDLGVVYFHEKKYDRAIEYLTQALRKKISPIHETMTYDTLGNIYKIRGELDTAVGYYIKATETTPAYVRSLNSLGDIYFGRGDYRAAKDHFEKAVEAWPDFALYNANLGTAYIMLGDKENALKYWKRSLEIDPNQPKIIEYISRNE